MKNLIESVVIVYYDVGMMYSLLNTVQMKSLYVNNEITEEGKIIVLEIRKTLLNVLKTYVEKGYDAKEITIALAINNDILIQDMENAKNNVDVIPVYDLNGNDVNENGRYSEKLS